MFRADSGPAGRKRQGVSCWVLLGHRARAGKLVIKLIGERLQGTMAPVPSPPVLPSEVRLRTLIKAQQTVIPAPLLVPTRTFSQSPNGGISGSVFGDL